MTQGRTKEPALVRQERTGHSMAERSGLACEAPTAPEWLKGDGLREWERVVPTLAAERILSAIDVMTLAAYCQTYASWREADSIVAIEGMTIESKGMQRIHPLAKHSATLLAELRRLAGEFGFTPKSRGSVKVAPRADVKKDSFESFLDGDDTGETDQDEE